MKSIGILICCVATALFAGAEPKEPGLADPLAIRIVPTRSLDENRSITLWKPEQHFHVIVANRSDKPVLVVTDKHGKSRVIKKAPRNWKKNIPDSTTIPSGNHLVYDVSFDPVIRPNGPLPAEGKSHVVKLKAVFEIKADDQATKNTVWTGKVESPEHSYTIYR